MSNTTINVFMHREFHIFCQNGKQNRTDGSNGKCFQNPVTCQPIQPSAPVIKNQKTSIWGPSQFPGWGFEYFTRKHVWYFSCTLHHVFYDLSSLLYHNCSWLKLFPKTCPTSWMREKNPTTLPSNSIQMFYEVKLQSPVKIAPSKRHADS